MDLIFDLETIPRPDLSEPNERVLAYGTDRLKDPKKIKAKREENRRKWYADAAVDPRRCAIVLAGVAQNDGPMSIAAACPRPDGWDAHASHAATIARTSALNVFWCGDEATLLRTLWRWLGDQDVTRLVGFSHRGFDLPVIFERSVRLHVRATRTWNRARFRSDLGILDWQEVLCDHGNLSMLGWSLSYYVADYGLDYIEPFGEGKDLPAKWEEGDIAWCVKHLAADLAMTRALHSYQLDRGRKV